MGNRAVVIGGIDRCDAIGTKVGPRYMAGTVTVLRGPVMRPRKNHGDFTNTLPRDVVAKQTVATNGTYRFVLAPGRYVLIAHFPPPANYAPLTQIRIEAGAWARVDIPNECI